MAKHFTENDTFEKLFQILKIVSEESGRDNLIEQILSFFTEDEMVEAVKRLLDEEVK